MECNKDEANRAKELAEKKMASNDFVGAQKIALKAKNLYPELDNISQLLSICDVHCSAQKRILGSEKDWYGILQVERLADDLAIKKQYRRLALILHPDKNRFPGAESAFKLICEANTVLSDTLKKSVYDSKIRVLVSAPVNRPPPHHVNKNYQSYKQNGVQNNVANGFSNMNQHQTPRFNSTMMPELFWTSCPFCRIQYQYHRKYVNLSLRCPTCSKNFLACEISVQGIPLSSRWGQPGAHVPPKSGSSQPASFQEKVPSGFGNLNRMGVQNEKGSGSDGIRGASTWKKSEDIKDNESKTHNANSMHGGKMRGNSSGVANNCESVNLNFKSKKRTRRVVVESSESFGTSSDSDTEDVTSSSNPATDGVHFPRRSSRKKQNISYNEADDDDIASPLKRSEASKDSDFPRGQSTETGTVRPEKILQEKDAKCDKEGKVGGETNGDETVEIKSDSDLEKDKCDCVDPDFSDFDKIRDPGCFEVDQFWACYDTFDGMPRFYAKVKKVFTSPFELSITWLEPVPIDEAHENYVENIPVGCGTFKFGKTERTSELLTFSHKAQFKKGIKRTLTIYPREGEVWALIKDWDTSWISNPENIKEFRYEVVEVLSEFVEGSGIRVGYLDKVAGFKCLFQRTSQSKTDSFMIRPDQLYKFSHLVSSFKMTGSEGEGVPIGSFELDPASLPLNPDHLYFPRKAKVES